MNIAVLGCGNRGGDVYAPLLTERGASISHVVDPDLGKRARVARRVGAAEQLNHWAAFFALGRVADAVVIATPDDQHVEPALRALDLGYQVLLEKPVAVSDADLDRLSAAEAASAGSVTVAHVLRTTAFFRAVQEVVSSGELGRLVGMTHLENVAYWHYAHSFVRGNWRLGPPAAPLILAKSSHDLDILRWLAGAPPAWVMAAGHLQHFRPEERPAGAAARCLDCPVPHCLADARRIYLTRPLHAWPNTVLSGDGTEAGLLGALRRGPYGECAYLGRNNQPDHLQALIGFQNGVQATLAVSAFTHDNTRTLKLAFTGGELRAQMELGELELHDFGRGTVEVRRPDTAGNHGGGDEGLVDGWLAFLRGEGPRPTPLEESLDSHRLAFAAERARGSGEVQRL